MGNKLVKHWNFKGTHTGTFFGIPATDKKVDINKYLDRQTSNTIDDARAFISKVNENINKGDSLYWAITLRDKNILVGTICLFGFSDENYKCEIGYELLTNFQGQGIMKEAV